MVLKNIFINFCSLILKSVSLNIFCHQKMVKKRTINFTTSLVENRYVGSLAEIDCPLRALSHLNILHLAAKKFPNLFSIIILENPIKYHAIDFEISKIFQLVRTKVRRGTLEYRGILTTSAAWPLIVRGEGGVINGFGAKFRSHIQDVFPPF